MKTTQDTTTTTNPAPQSLPKAMTDINEILRSEFGNMDRRQARLMLEMAQAEGWVEE